MSTRDEPFKATRDALTSAVRAALDEAGAIADSDVAYQQASWLVDVLSAGMTASGRLRVDAARRIKDENHLSLSQLGERLGVSKARAADMLRVPQVRRPEGPPLIAALVTSQQGVLAARSPDKKAGWAFIAGEQKAGESIAQAGHRVIEEQTGLAINAGRTIARETSPESASSTIYVAAKPAYASKLDVDRARSGGWAEVRWLTLAEAEEYLPDMYAPVHAYLSRALRPRDLGA